MSFPDAEPTMTTGGAVAAPTPEQERVIGLGIDGRAVVLAGPGTGKTYTLLRRATALLAEHELDASQLLVLSFTRAVIRELRRRDRLESAPARLLPETFDSFASRLLREVAPGGSWERSGFDGRIEAATRLLREGAGATVLGDVRHILVDEVQDLIDVRARFVAQMLAGRRTGWTAFGDPAQAIYNHEHARPDEVTLIASLRRDADTEISLTVNHRASGALAHAAAQLRMLLIDGSSDAPDRVWNAYRDLDTVGDVHDLAGHLGKTSGTFAILCRDNATALQCSDSLHAAAVTHRVRRGTADRPVAGWLGAALRGRSTITPTACRERVDTLTAVGFPALPDPDEAWRVLAQMDRNSRAGAVRAAEVASRLSVARVPWALLDEPYCDVTVSSIHRAKGLEFDRCAIADWRPHKDANASFEGRVLYVALTRAKTDCFHVAREGRQRWFRNSEAHDRFIKRGREDWQTFGIEIRGDDVHAVEPGGGAVIDVAADEIQDMLIARVRVGDEVTLVYAGEHCFSSRTLPSYAIHHAAGVLGITGEGFGRALTGRLRARRRPERITNVRVDDLETVKGSGDVGASLGLGASGIWLRPRLIGLGDFDWG